MSVYKHEKKAFLLLHKVHIADFLLFNRKNKILLHVIYFQNAAQLFVCEFYFKEN